MKKRIFLITGATGLGKTKVARALARQFDGVLIPIDQLQMYKGLGIGVGLEYEGLRSLDAIGYGLFDPSIRLTPAAYMEWLVDTVEDVPLETPIFIEGGSTTFVRELLQGDRFYSRRSAVETLVVSPPDCLETRWKSLWEHYSNERIFSICDELTCLMESGLLRSDGFDLLGLCEKLVMQPDHRDSSCAWALRASACVYFPALRLALNLDNVETTRFRMVSNVYAVQQHQIAQLQAICPPKWHLSTEDISIRIRLLMGHRYRAQRPNPAVNTDATR